MWNERYSEEGYAYGTEPNEYLKEQLEKLSPGSILFAAEGEGRNAVYAAQLGWNVFAFDLSVEGKKKAEALGHQKGVEINYLLGELPELGFKPGQLDAIVLIYAHFPSSIRSTYHKLLASYLKPGGTMILEAFSKNNLSYREENPRVGGPNNIDFLVSTEELDHDFPDFEVLENTEKIVSLNEGKYHIGTGSVVRFFGKKK